MQVTPRDFDLAVTGQAVVPGHRCDEAHQEPAGVKCRGFDAAVVGVPVRTGNLDVGAGHQPGVDGQLGVEHDPRVAPRLAARAGVDGG